ncbi:hypothetical protein FAM09_14510 [Niastella caeni]|uniref:Uncharacterized protein n=1 Tax=Niastella caeni TaxID=2569763 RepID=A0A4S8HW83_9BACT|nr:hypothetical protein [Niastella caeni]THU39705.1 hypothetical protein FAM09_14510 [Niastella caeni]
MRRLFNKWILLAGFFSPLALAAQNVSLGKLLSLQKSSLISIQDYIETGMWKLKGITTLREVDSSIFQSRTRRFLDSLAIHRKPEGNPLTANFFHTQLLENTKFEAPAWIEYLSLVDTKINSKTLFTNSFTITMPKFFLFNAIDLKVKSFDKHTFHHSLRFSFGDLETFKSTINEIGILQIPEKDCYVMYNDPLITRVYKLTDQVIRLTIINSQIPSYSLEIHSRSDYDYLHGTEQSLKGKVDFIH